ncbi:MAG: hypothetical protein WD852_05780 [Methyloceanibacter sp.]
MRLVLALTLFAGLVLVAPGPASAIPPSFGDYAAAHRALSSGTEVIKRRPIETRRQVRRYDRRYGWTNRPYWRPYQYRYWKFYYPYGGPLF